jgi:ATP-dependent protease ClpP protease subunit
MEKIPFNIHASTQGQKALIRITGTIGWDTDSEQFRRTVDAIVEQGITDAHLYLNGPGGSCFDAEEIVNILSVFTGKVTGYGGTLVASAYTRIAMFCESFTMPENGMFMIHKPAGGTWGTANEIASYLKLIRDIESQYFNTYKEKATDSTILETQWNAGDWWMTAQEAKDNGFIVSIKEKAKIGAHTTALISACGCPASKIPTININEKEENEMDLKATAKALGLPESASEAEVNTAIANGVKATKDLAELQASIAQKEKEQKAKDIKAVLDKAIADKRITADMRPNWEKMLNADFETASASLEELQVVKKLDVKPPSNGGASASAGKVTHQGKTFEELQDENPDALAELQNTDPTAYDALFNDYVKRNKL